MIIIIVIIAIVIMIMAVTFYISFNFPFNLYLTTVIKLNHFTIIFPSNAVLREITRDSKCSVLTPSTNWFPRVKSNDIREIAVS